MKKQYRNLFLLVIFIILGVLILLFAQKYKTLYVTQALQKECDKKTQTATTKFQTLLQEKKNSTLAIALLLAKNEGLKTLFLEGKDPRFMLQNYSKELGANTDFKNVWIQLVDTKGFVYARSWSELKGDELIKFRKDFGEVLAHPHITTSVSVGRFDLSIKALVPLYTKKDVLLGYVEVITHFNSIVEKMAEDGIETLVFADKIYKKQLTNPFNARFIGEYYLANKNANPTSIDYVAKKGLEKLLQSDTPYKIDESSNLLISSLSLFNDDNTILGHLLFFQKIDPHANESMTTFTNVMLFFAFLFLIVVYLFLFKKEESYFQSREHLFKNSVSFVLLFLLFSFLHWMVLSFYEKSIQKGYLRDYNSFVLREYNTLLHHYFNDPSHLALGDLTKEIKDIYHSEICFYVAKSAINTKLVRESFSNYKQSNLKDFYQAQLNQSKTCPLVSSFAQENLSEEQKNFANHEIAKGEVFTLFGDDSQRVFSFFPIKDPDNHQLLGAIVVEAQSTILQEQKQLFTFFLISGILVIFIVTLFIFREFLQKLQLRALDKNPKYFGYAKLDNCSDRWVAACRCQ